MSAAKCLKCKHYYSTWDPQMPRGCKLFGIKTKYIPSILVQKETGAECSGFDMHPNHKKKEADSKNINYNDAKYW